MALPDNSGESTPLREVTVEFELAFVSTEALLKACYWYSRDFVCEMRKTSDAAAVVVLAPRNPTAPFDRDAVKDAFVTCANDFALREKIEAKTSSVRDLLLAKAFSEAGVLEDSPSGLFGDAIEEAKPDGMFKILSGPHS